MEIALANDGNAGVKEHCGRHTDALLVATERNKPATARNNLTAARRAHVSENSELCERAHEI